MNETPAAPGSPRVPDHESRAKGSGWAGIAWTLLLHAFIGVPLGFATGGMAWVLFGAAQLVYIVPALLVFWLRGATDTAKGVLIGGALTLLVNGACFAIVTATMDWR